MLIKFARPFKNTALNRNKHLTLLIVCSLSLHTVMGQPDSALYKNIKQHVGILASDSLMGRATGTIGEQMAASYIAGQFMSIGLKPAANNSYFQHFDIYRKHPDFSMVKHNNNIIISPWHFFHVSNHNYNDTIKTDLFFCGDASNQNIAGFDVKNKAIAFICNNVDSAYLTIKKVNKKFGNKLFFVLLTNDNSQINKAWENNYYMQQYALMPELQTIIDEQKKFAWVCPDMADSVNVFFCFDNVLQKFLGYTTSQLERIASQKQFNKVKQISIECIINKNDSIQNLGSKNIAALYNTNKSAKTIVVSAHYDHLGVEMGETYYGADDNASGVATIIEMARFVVNAAKNGANINCNLLFIAFSAEELGLLGSLHYTRKPLLPLSQTLLNINYDMVGRNDDKNSINPNYVYLLRTNKNIKKLVSIAKHQKNRADGFKIKTHPGKQVLQTFYSGSDHYSFSSSNIPALVFFTGLHPDYHTPGDTPDKINYQNLTNIASFSGHFLLRLATDTTILK